MADRLHCTPGGNVWHSITSCSQYPRLDYWSHSRLPAGSELCAECQQLQKDAIPSWRDQAEHIF